jgi:hypothetical protein
MDSNVVPPSNVFPISAAHVNPAHQDQVGHWFAGRGAFDDPQFRRQVFGREELETLARHFVGLQINWQAYREALADRVSEEQIEVSFRAVGAGNCGCPGVGKTIGIVRVRGRIEVQCRCPNPRCELPQHTNLLNGRA